MDSKSEMDEGLDMSEDSWLHAVVTFSTLTVYLTAESLCRRIPCVKKFDNYYEAGSRHLQSFSFPLMCLDAMVVAGMLAGTIYAAVVTDITLYPLIYPQTAPSPPTIVCVLLAVNLGRHVAKLHFAIHNRPAEKTVYPLIVCLLVCGFIITALTSYMYMGLCLIGILSETSSLLKWLHYLPSDVTTRCWFSALVIVKFLVTFLSKGVFAIALSCLAFVVQVTYILDCVPVTQYCPLTVLAAFLMILNFVHMVTFTMFTMGHFKSKPRKFRFDGWNTLPKSALNSGAKCSTKVPICYVNNAIRKTAPDISDRDVHLPRNPNLKEKNCNVELEGKQQQGMVSRTGSSSDQHKNVNKKPAPSKARKPAPVTCMVTIPEETASQVSVTTVSST